MKMRNFLRDIRHRALSCFCIIVIVVSPCAMKGAETKKPVLVPMIDGDWWIIAGNPMDHKYATEKQEPVDFAVWQAADGTWQLWSCLRRTKAGGEQGKERFFYRWEGKKITDTNWKPMGIAMEADPSLGETPGGVQAPHVIKVGDLYHLFYGDYLSICHAVSKDGKNFERVIQGNGKTGMFSEEMATNTPKIELKYGIHARDVMLSSHNGKWYAYYTANLNNQGPVYVRTTTDFKNWSESEVVSFGGLAGTGAGSAECPFMVKLSESDFYLFTTKTYGDYDREKDDIRNRDIPQTNVYYSQNPMKFGINQDAKYFIGQLPVAAPEIVFYDRQYYIFALKQGSLEGIRCAKLKWVKQK